MWEIGMLENMHSGHTGLNEIEIEHFGMDPDSVLAIEDQDYQVQVNPPTLHLTEEQVAELPDPLANDENSGKELYLQCVETLSMFAAVVDADI
jgi:hypothetical protein